MFFPRLRRSTKPVFLGLAVIFAVSFVFLGVGSGSTGLGDLLQGNFSVFGIHFGSSGGGSVSKAQKEIKQHPNSPKGYRDLATAYESKQQDEKAISALERYAKLRPKDQVALRELASLYISRAQTLSSQARATQSVDPLAGAAQIFTPTATSKLGAALQDPIVSAVSQQVNTSLSTASVEIQQVGAKAVQTYKRLAALNPSDASTQIQLAQTAEQAGDVAAAVAAYKQVIKLEPDSSDVPAIKQRIKQLQASSTGATVTSG